MIRAGLIRLIHGPPLSGWSALFCLAFAIGLPTAVRAAVNGVVTGCEFTPYLPFILLCAMALRGWQAAVAALASVIILGGLFGGTIHDRDCFISSSTIFLASSAGMIAVALLVRRAFRAGRDRGAAEALDGIVFSLEKGEVWASWYGRESRVRLGAQRSVSEMMDDFLAQEELGRRLARRR